jgi:thiosulfate/3-mercaptopyruvate sulfurtransferase
MRAKKYLKLFLTTIAVTSMMVGCSPSQSSQSKDTTTEFKTISTNDLKENVDNDSWVVVDTRITDAYNGWKLEGVKRGGHIAKAVDFSSNWLKVEAKDKEKALKEALETKKITPDKNVVLYDANGKDVNEVAEYLSDKGYKNIYTYNVNEWANDESLPMESYKNYQLIVPPAVVKDVIDGKTPETFEKGKKIKIVEASWGEESESYAKGHVPTSFHINTDSIEPPPAWMLADDKELTKFALDNGFTKDDAVIVTGENPMAAYRVATVLKYMGVSDVRVLNGGLSSWKLAGYEVEKTSNKPTSVSDFGAKIPANPNIIDTMEETKAGLNTPDKFTLVDNRTWEEHIGKSSGYSYHNKKGRIPGSVYGYAGIGDSNSLQYYRNIDNTMRNADEIQNLWKTSNIDTNKHLSFMCGSGWRAAEVFIYANVAGFENTSIYSNGWIEWSNNSNNPIEKGEPAK